MLIEPGAEIGFITTWPTISSATAGEREHSSY
jgi:hypothetical protein